MAQSIKCVTTKLPSYLQILLQEDSNIKFVWRELKQTEGDLLHLGKNENSLSEEISELDLTGTPLQTDLGGDADISVDTDGTLGRPPSWTAEEAQQGPLTLNVARAFINNHLKLGKPSVSIFSICDGHDEHHTVVLGATVTSNKLSRFLVHVLPCYNENHEITTEEYMKNDHIKNSVRRDEKAEISRSQSYNLFGYSLTNCHALQNAEHNGNISVDVFSAENYKGYQNNSNIKMNLQVVVGHKDSPLMDYWSQLWRIQSYIKLLESMKQLNDSTVMISENNLDLDEICSVISDIVNTVASSKKKTSETLDLKNVRQLNILDKLWNTLQHCHTLSDLRDCFHLFFGELAQQELKIHSLGEDKSSVGEIVNGILDGKTSVPTLSFSQSLELLIDLGLEKLKKDYLVIISSIYSVSKEIILKKWNELLFDNSAIKSTQRRTRISINPKTLITDLISNKLKLTFVDSLHKISEFMFLYKGNLPLSDEGFNSFCEILCNRFIDKFPKVVQSCDLKQPRLCRFSFDISSADADLFIKGKSPVTSTVKLTSRVEDSEVTTIYHFSEYPIFPPSIFDDYEIPEDTEITNIYVTKLVKYVQHV